MYKDVLLLFYECIQRDSLMSSAGALMRVWEQWPTLYVGKDDLKENSGHLFYSNNRWAGALV